MNKIVSLSGIKDVLTDEILSTHITTKYMLYIPKLLGGVTFEVYLKDTTLVFYFKRAPVEYKRYYLLEFLKGLNLGNNVLPLQLELYYNKDKDMWEGYLEGVSK